MSFKLTIKKIKKLPGVKKITYSSYNDKRGYVYSVIDKKLTKSILPKNMYFNQTKINFRKKKVLVGFHYDTKTWKLLTCLKGKIFHVVVKINSSKKIKNFTHQLFILNEKKKESILIPPGYGNGFYCLEDSIISYSLAFKGKYIDANNQKTLPWNDKRIKINWPNKKPILSSRDRF